MQIKTNRLTILPFNLTMAKDVHLNSLDEDILRFVPDEYFETEDIAKEVIASLMTCYDTKEGPFVYPVLLEDGKNIGYVQLVKIDLGFEVGYHIAKAYTNQGYASEALKAFLEVMKAKLGLDEVFGVVNKENTASIRVLEKCGFKKMDRNGKWLYSDKK